MGKNQLYYGDNLPVLREHIKDQSVDLIYLDPPFNSRQDYNVLFAERNGSRSASQIMAFEDTWEWNEDSARVCEEIIERGGIVSQVIQAFRTFLLNSDMMAYLAMMAPRLIELHRVLKIGGSIYLHCDPTASHYLKMLMDAVFRTAAFQNEIVWSYRRWPSPSKHFQRMHDTLLFYCKESDRPQTFHVEYEPNSPSYQKRFKGKTQMLDPETRSRKITLEAESKGLPRRDVWDLSIIAGSKKERLGYPTQKPEALLERIIQTSSNKGDVVLDPFCGCGTSIAVAQRLNRRWIGIDITHLAIGLIKKRLDDAFGSTVRETYEVVGEPVDLSGAQRLAQDDPYQFQWWALSLVGARPVEKKKGADRGIDGRLYFHDEKGGKTKQIILSVKAGKLHAPYVRDLRGVIEREKSEIGVLISMEPPTKPMQKEAAEAGFYKPPGLAERYPRIQILSIAELLEGKKIDYPRYAADATFKRAPKSRKAAEEQIPLNGEDEEPF